MERSIIIEMEIEFRNITEFPRGTLAALLRDGYSFEPQFERGWSRQWQEFDDFFYDNPRIAESCGFMTVLAGEPVGFVTWNPTNMPESIEVGHNCISTKHKGKGYGRCQMREAVRRIAARQPKKILVCTNEICVPAQHTYESAGFQFVERSGEPVSPYAGERIHYEILTASYNNNPIQED